MSECQGIPGELIYQYTLQFTQVVEYGISANAVLSGRMPPPAEGARFDVHFEGPIAGPKLKGTVKGVDYLHIRADGRGQLNIHAEITPEDGKKIALAACVLAGCAARTMKPEGKPGRGLLPIRAAGCESP